METHAQKWRQLVETRRRSFGPERPANFWERQAGRYAFSMRQQADPFWDFVQPWLRPVLTAIDAGAGTGRHAVPLADRLDWVTAVEPEEAMRRLIPDRPNMTVVASTWEEADVAPADLVISCHVLYSIPEPVPFLEKMSSLARERAFVSLRDGPQPHPAERLAGKPLEPTLSDVVDVLEEMGLKPEVERWRQPVVFRWEDRPSAEEDWRLRGWSGALEGVEEAAEGTLRFDAGMRVGGVAHWKRTS